MYKLVQEQLMPLNDTSAHLLQVFTFQTFLVIIKLDTTNLQAEYDPIWWKDNRWQNGQNDMMI